jgi:hypothetical protein
MQTSTSSSSTSSRPRPAFLPGELKAERSLIRLAVAHCIAATRPEGAHVPNVLRELYPNDRLAPVIFHRAASSPATTTGSGWADTLAATAVEAFIRSLKDSAGAVLINAGYKLDLTGAARINMPHVTAGGQAVWLAEGDRIPVGMGTTAAGQLGIHKLALIEVLTRESLEASPSDAENWMTVVLQDVATAAVDTSLFANTAASATRPAGLVAGITPLAASATGNAFVDCTADFRALTDAICQAGGGGRILYFCSMGRALAAKSLLPAVAPQIYGSAFIPSAELFAVAVGAFVTAFGPEAEIRASKDAVLHFEDTTPVDIGTGAGVAAPSKSLFQTDSIAFRMVLRAGWGLRLPNTAAWIQTGMAW